MGEFLSINKSKLTNADHFNFMEEFKLSLLNVDISDNAKLTAAFGQFNDAFTEEDNYYMLSRYNYNSRYSWKKYYYFNGTSLLFRSWN